MRGRKPKPAGLKAAQGNPGRREIPVEPPQPSVSTPAPHLPFAKLSDAARAAYQIIGEDLRRMNFVRRSDESVLLRYCDSLARYWRVTEELDRLGGETYECKTT